MRNAVKSLLKTLGLKVSRPCAAGRFQAMDACLERMRALHYEPAVIIDGGANFGQFYGLASAVYPRAEFHLIEPQAACAPELTKIAGRSSPRIHVHNVALSEPGVNEVRLLGTGPNGGGSGAHVAEPEESEPNELVVPATTLDKLLSGVVADKQRSLLKLDVEGHELAILRGAPKLLEKVEAVLLEVRFYDIQGSGRPVFKEVASFVHRRGFHLYDIASLSPRPRDMRLRMGDVMFVRTGSRLLLDDGWA